MANHLFTTRQTEKKKKNIPSTHPSSILLKKAKIHLNAHSHA